MSWINAFLYQCTENLVYNSNQKTLLYERYQKLKQCAVCGCMCVRVCICAYVSQCVFWCICTNCRSVKQIITKRMYSNFMKFKSKSTMDMSKRQTKLWRRKNIFRHCDLDLQSKVTNCPITIGLQPVQKVAIQRKPCSNRYILSARILFTDRQTDRQTYIHSNTHTDKL